MATFHASRTIAADPASLALLLAGPTAHEQFADESALAGAGVTVEITAPLRSGVGFRANVTVFSDGHEIADGSITVSPARGGGTALDIALRPKAGINVAALRHWLTLAIGEFADTARSRSTAA